MPLLYPNIIFMREKGDLCDGYHDCRLLSLHYDSDRQEMQPSLHDVRAIYVYPPLNATSNPLCDRQHDGYHCIWKRQISDCRVMMTMSTHSRTTKVAVQWIIRWTISVRERSLGVKPWSQPGPLRFRQDIEIHGQPTWSYSNRRKAAERTDIKCYGWIFSLLWCKVYFASAQK